MIYLFICDNCSHELTHIIMYRRNIDVYVAIFLYRYPYFFRNPAE